LQITTGPWQFAFLVVVEIGMSFGVGPLLTLCVFSIEGAFVIAVDTCGVSNSAKVMVETSSLKNFLFGWRM
jgi:hypothetical protein